MEMDNAANGPITSFLAVYTVRDPWGRTSTLEFHQAFAAWYADWQGEPISLGDGKTGNATVQDGLSAHGIRKMKSNGNMTFAGIRWRDATAVQALLAKTSCKKMRPDCSVSPPNPAAKDQNMTKSNNTSGSTETNQLGRPHVVAACLAVLTREIHCAGVEQHDALDLLRDAPDKIEAALTRGPGALVVYRLDPNGARGVVTDSESRLGRFVAAAEYESAPLFGFCPATIAELAAHVDAGAASLKKGG